MAVPEMFLPPARHAALAKMQRFTAADPLYQDILRRKRIDADRSRARRATRERTER